MIEINVLPPEYRSVERTPLHLYVSFIGGVVILAFLLVIYWNITLTLSDKKQTRKELNQTVTSLEKQAQEITRIEKELSEAKQRVQTVVQIAQKKMFWSQKLDQLHSLIPPMIWIEGFEFGALPELPEGERALVLNSAARGNDPERVKKFLAQLARDTNFIYHFQDPIMREITVEDANARYDGNFIIREVSVFDVLLRLKPTEFEQAQQQGPGGPGGPGGQGKPGQGKPGNKQGGGGQ